MTAISYYGIEEKIRDIIISDPDLSTVKAFIEEDLIFSAEASPAAFIYLESRDAVESDQRISAGRRTDYILRLSVWAVEWHQDSVSTAAKLRDDLIGRIELTLMENRTLGGLVDAIWLGGGDFENGFGESGFLSAGQIVVMARVGAVI